MPPLPAPPRPTAPDWTPENTPATPERPGKGIHRVLSPLPQSPRRVLVGPRRTSDSKIDSPGKQRLQRAELFCDHQRRVIRQHDPARSHPDFRRSGRHVRNDHRGRRARDSRHVVVLRQPETPKAQVFHMPRQLQRRAQGIRHRSAVQNRTKIENRKRNHDSISSLSQKLRPTHVQRPPPGLHFRPLPFSSPPPLSSLPLLLLLLPFLFSFLRRDTQIVSAPRARSVARDDTHCGPVPQSPDRRAAGPTPRIVSRCGGRRQPGRYSQARHLRPGTRWNSFTLAVSRVAPALLACAAIN